ncbi:diguanylate cyclase/phosphodiesterase (GGDEF & EAL domains) with PAS/PAC sensor(s), partial [hydrothermal vent metagenome]
MKNLAEQGLKIASLFDSIINSLPTPIFVKDNNHRWLLVNDAFCELMGRSRTELLGKSDYDFFDKHEADVFWEMDDRVFTNREVNVNQESFTDSAGINHILQTRKMVFIDDKLGDVLCGVITDITELKRYEKDLNEANDQLKLKVADRNQELKNVNEKLLWMANVDPITDLMNRSALEEVASDFIKKSDQGGDPFAMIFLDLDDFKFINESYGHPVGDALIRAVGLRLNKVLKSRGAVARVGGDEFMILLAYKNKADVEAVTKKIIRLLKIPFDSNRRRLFINASLGIACYPDDGSDLITLAQHADAAMYVAKNNNKGGHQFYQEAYTMTIKRKLEMDVYLRGAIKSKELEVHFQPIFNTLNNTVAGYEALARWNDKVFGPVNPDEFIAIAEQSDLILHLGEQVVEQSIQFIHNHCQAGEYVSINVSPKQLMHPSFKAGLIDQINKTSTDPKQLVIEVTENVMVKMNDFISQLTQETELAGIRFFVDDFGTGYSNLSQLKKIKFAALKIDRTFVKELPHSHTDKSLVKIMIL